MSVQPQVPMDNATFLDWVQGREDRYELAGGHIITLPHATRRHAQIVGNLFQMLCARLDRKQWNVLFDFGIDIRPGTLRYADIVVDRCGAKGDTLATKAPVLVTEVLSPSTVKNDLGDKPASYLQFSSLAAYLVFAQDEMKAWTRIRGAEGRFAAGLQMVAGADASISIPALKIELPLAEIYEGIEFD